MKKKGKVFLANECMTNNEEIDNRKCLSKNSFKVIVNRRNIVPFHFEEFYNDHVQFVILLQVYLLHAEKKRKSFFSE